MATPQAAVPAVEETKVQTEKAFAFVPLQPTRETYLQSIADRFKSRKDSKKVGCCPYDAMVDVVRARIGNDFYVLEAEPDMFVEEVNVRVWHDELSTHEFNTKEDTLLAMLTVVLQPRVRSRNLYRGEMSGVFYSSVPSVIVHQQNCPNDVLKTIVKNIAPPGLEAVVAPD